jgi:hypothetical protein
MSISFGNLDDGSLVWAAPERRPYFPNWNGGERTRIYRLRSIDAEPELLCTAPTGRLFSFLGQSGSWAVWDTGSIGRTEYTSWGCNVATGETREIEEWRPWVHSAAAITDRGLWSPRGWVPLSE